MSSKIAKCCIGYFLPLITMYLLAGSDEEYVPVGVVPDDDQRVARDGNERLKGQQFGHGDNRTTRP